MALVKCHTWYNEEKWLPAEKLVQRPSVYGLVIHDDKLLVVQSQHGHRYALPGGGIEKGEEIEAALIREMREETSLEIEVGEFLHFTTNFFYYDPLDQAIHGFLFFYRCIARSIDLTIPNYPPDEGLEQPLWVSIDTLNVSAFQTRPHGELVMSLLSRPRPTT